MVVHVLCPVYSPSLYGTFSASLTYIHSHNSHEQAICLSFSPEYVRRNRQFIPSTSPLHLRHVVILIAAPPTIPRYITPCASSTISNRAYYPHCPSPPHLSVARSPPLPPVPSFLPPSLPSSPVHRVHRRASNRQSYLTKKIPIPNSPPNLKYRENCLPLKSHHRTTTHQPPTAPPHRPPRLEAAPLYSAPMHRTRTKAGLGRGQRGRDPREGRRKEEIIFF